MRKLICSLLFVVLLVCLSAQAWAVSYDVQINSNNYGHLSQFYAPSAIMPIALQQMACVPVATANSFAYLENMYPSVYGRNLIPDNNPANSLVDLAEIDAVAATLTGLNYMNTKVANGGTFQDMAIYGKHKYIEEQVPGVTIYAAQMSGTWAWPGGRLEDEIPPIEKPDWVMDNMFPQWQFLYQNLLEEEDIEICINEGEWGHCLTLTGFHWNDGDGDGIIDDMGAHIDYIDPWTGAAGASSISQGALNGAILVNYSVTYPFAQLKMAMKESIPEPSTLVLIGVGAISLLVYTRRRK
jgi:hypothetical protein